MITPTPYQHPVQTTEPDIFIIESLSVDDEIHERFQGKALCTALKIFGLKPAYYYVRNKNELIQVIELFRHSSYRFIHLSMHGSSEEVYTTIDRLPNKEFASLFAGKLKNRRLFIASCDVGSGGLCDILQGQNQGLYSVAAPLEKIPFGIACAFWMAFYTRLLTEKPSGMKKFDIQHAFSQLSKFFNLRLRWSYYDPHPSVKKWISVEIS